LKQISKLRSLNSNTSTNLSLSLSSSSINSLTPRFNHRLCKNTEESYSASNPFADLFSYNKTSSKLGSNISLATTVATRLENNLSTSNDNLNKSVHSKNISFSSKRNLNLIDKKDESLNASFNLSTNHQRISIKNETDQVYDVISNIIHNKEANLMLIDKEFIENVKKVVIQTELLKKKKIYKSIFICRITMFLFLFLFTIMLIYFLQTLNIIATNLNTNLKCMSLPLFEIKDESG
jgi:hypothetical protein